MSETTDKFSAQTLRSKLTESQQELFDKSVDLALSLVDGDRDYLKRDEAVIHLANLAMAVIELLEESQGKNKYGITESIIDAFEVYATYIIEKVENDNVPMTEAAKGDAILTAMASTPAFEKFCREQGVDMRVIAFFAETGLSILTMITLIRVES